MVVDASKLEALTIFYVRNVKPINAGPADLHCC